MFVVVAIAFGLWLGLGLLALFACVAGARAEKRAQSVTEARAEASRQQKRSGTKATIF